MNNVLIITYYWPPSGGAGVQRWLKFSKYLPGLGWQPFIVTVDPDYAAYPVTDITLQADFPSSVKVYPTHATNYFSFYRNDNSKIPAAGFANSIDNTLKGKIIRFVRGNFFLPDPRRGWNKYAFKKACELIDKKGIRNIITTSPPHSSQLIGLKIKRKYPSVNWIADLRDPWTDIYYYKQFYHMLPAKLTDKHYEKTVLRKADRIITVGNSLKNIFASKIKGIEDKTTVITNGYDEEDFKGMPSSTPSLFTITYVGTLSDIYPIEGLLDALTVFNGKGHDYLLRFIGTVSQNQKDLIRSKTRESQVDFISYVDHSEAIRFMFSTSALLLIIPDHFTNKSIITGKLFEYLATGKPIVCLGPPDGDAAAIIAESRHGNTFSYSDSAAVAQYLSEIISIKKSDTLINIAEAYSRSALAKKIIPMLIEGKL